ncbi:MAG: DeoR/GlpR family DNA-binding transcription regulator [Bacillota bacterium]
MFAEERKKKIIKLLQKEKRASVKELSERFDVSRATIRRDLSDLEKKGFLRRTHGGAILSGSSKIEPSFQEKEDKFIKEKVLIGKKAAEIIQSGDTIFIDAGTTTRQIIEFLIKKENLTIVTHALHIVNRINELNLNCELVVVGGNFKWKTEAMIGPMAENFLKDLRVDKAFIGSNGFTIEDGGTTPDINESKIKSIALNSAQEKYLVFDSSKWGEIYFSRFIKTEDLDFIISNKADVELEDRLKKNNVDFIKAQ